jgi:hypothetical protein
MRDSRIPEQIARRRQRAVAFSFESALSAQCGISMAFLWDAAARRASLGFGVCNHRESGVR